MVKNLPVMQETWVLSLGQEDPLEKGMAIHSRMLPAEFHGQRSLVGYSPWGHRVGHNWVINTITCPLRQSSHSRWSNSILESEPETNASWQARSPAFDLQRALFGSERCWETAHSQKCKEQSCFWVPADSDIVLGTWSILSYLGSQQFFRLTIMPIFQLRAHWDYERSYNSVKDLKSKLFGSHGFPYMILPLQYASNR